MQANIPTHLSADEVDHFHRVGALYPRRVLVKNDALTLAEELQRFAQGEAQPLTRLLRFKAHLMLQSLRSLASHRAILDAVESLIGPDLLVFTSTIWAKAPHDPHFVSWHQDSAYFGLDPHEEVTAWIALTDSQADNGCLRVLPGSHTGSDYQHDETRDQNNLLIRGQTIRGIDESSAIDIELSPGEFSLHHERTVHGSHANSSSRPRIGYAVFYIPTHVRSTLGRRDAWLVRGHDRFGHWNSDPQPQCDADPRIRTYMRETFERYRDQQQR